MEIDIITILSSVIVIFSLVTYYLILRNKELYRENGYLKKLDMRVKIKDQIIDKYETELKRKEEQIYTLKDKLQKKEAVDNMTAKQYYESLKAFIKNRSK